MNVGESSSILVRLAGWSAAHPWTAVAGAIIVLAASVLSINRMRLDTSVHAMLGEETPSAAALSRLGRVYRSADELFVLATLPDNLPVDTEALTGFAARLEAEVRNHPGAGSMVTHIRWHEDAELRRFVREVVVPNGAHYLSDAAWSEFRERLSRDGMRRQVARDEALMAAPGPGASAIADRLVRDPLRLMELVPGGGPRTAESGEEPRAELSANGRTLLIRIGGVRASSDLEFSTRFVDALAACVARAGSMPLSVELAGGYAIAARTSSAMRTDAIVSTLVSVALLHVLFSVLYRRWLAPIVILGVAGLGITAGFGVHGLTAGSITPLTAVIAAMLAGLGVDYGIHFLSHYQSYRAEGREPGAAAAETARHLGIPIVTNCLTSVFGFASLWFASVAMLRDFAVLGAIGLLGCVVATFTVLPGVLVLTDRGKAGSPVGPPRFAAIATPAIRRPAMCIGLAGVLLGVMVAVGGARGMLPGLEADLTVLHPRPNRPLELTHEITTRFAGIAESVPIEVTSREDVVAAAHRVARALDTPALRRAGVLSDASIGLHSLLPDPAAAADRVRVLQAMDADRVVADFDAAIADSIFDPAAFSEYREFLRTLVSAHRPPRLEDLDAYPAIRDRVIPDQGRGPPDRAVLAVAVEEPLSDRSRREAVVTALRGALSDHPDATLTGMSVVGHDLERATRGDLPRSVAVSLALVVLWLLLVFRRPSDVALALVPIAFAVVCTVGFLAATGQRFNPINAVALPLLDGIAVDAGVFLVAASRTGPRNRAALARRFRTTGPAVLAAALTTVAGFGALAFTRTPAIRSLGIAASVGILAAFAGALLLLMPLLLRRAASDPEPAP